MRAMTYERELTVALDLGRTAAQRIAASLGRAERSTKTHATTVDEAVTEVDRANQRLIAEGLRAAFPDDGFIGEESDDGAGITNRLPVSGQRVWVVDPIDGTNNFIAGMPLCAACIGLLDAGVPVVGVVADAGGRVWSARRDGGAFLDERRVSVAPGALSARSLLMATSNVLRDDGTLPGWASALWGQTTWKLRLLGSAALECVASGDGSAHAAITVHGKLWDVAAAAAIVLEAGGVVKRFDGGEVFPYATDSYRGAKVPFISGASAAVDELLALTRARP